MRSETTRQARASTEASPLDVLGAAWAAEILLCLHEEPRHFNALRRRLDGLPASTLSTRLGELLEAGLVVRCECGGRPERVVYSLPPRGTRLAATLMRLDELEVRGDDRYSS